jgi:exocyst complex component 3
MADYQSYLNPSLLDLLIEDLIEAFLVLYITALVNAPKMKMPAATDRIKDDVSTVFSFLTTLKPAKEVEAQFEVVEMILAMLEASKSLVFLSYWQFAKVHGPNLQFVESLMRNRDDLDRSAVNDVMESIKRKVNDEGLTDRMFSPALFKYHALIVVVAPEPTIMKKIALQSGFSRILRAVA